MSDDIEVSELRDDIEQTRESMSETIEHLEERLAPERLQHDTTEIVREVADKIIAEVQSQTGDLTQQISEQIQSAVHGAATAKSEEVLTQAMGSIRTVGSALWDRVGSSPAPVALAAVGIGLLAAGGSSAASHQSRPDMVGQSENGGSIQSQAMGVFDSVRAKASEVSEQATGAVSDAGQESGALLDQAKSMVGNASMTPEQAKSIVSDQPVLAGLLALGLGAALGLSLPTTPQEREATSSLRTQAHQRLDERGIATDPSGMLDQAKQQLSSVGEALSDAVSDSLEQAKEGATDIAATAKESATTAAKDRGLTR